MPAAKGVRATLMEYFTKNVGQYVYINDLTKSTGLKVDQVQGNINNIIRDHKLGKLDFPITIITRGQIWIYKPSDKRSSTTDKRMFEELGKTKRGTLVLQDEQGNLFEATEL
jgi:hypothetical protein